MNSKAPFAIKFGLLNGDTVVEIQVISDIFIRENTELIPNETISGSVSNKEMVANHNNEIKFTFECNPDDVQYIKDLSYMEGYLHFIDNENESNTIPPLRGFFKSFNFIKTSYDWLQKCEAIFSGDFQYLKEKAETAQRVYEKVTESKKQKPDSRIKRNVKRKLTFI